MAAITFEGMTLTGDHASRPAATAVGAGSLYACSDHDLIYQSDAATWSTWADISGSGSTGTADALQTLTGALSAVEGAIGYDTDDDYVKVYDGQRDRVVSSVGWTPTGMPIPFDPGAALTNALTLAANGGSLAIPMQVPSDMLLYDVVIRNTDTGTQRTWRWDLYVNKLNNGNGSENTADRIATCSAAETFTPSGAASFRFLTASAVTYIPRGTYWLVVQCTHATNNFGFGTTTVVSTNVMAGVVSGITKTTSNPNGATLDLVAATWTKQSATMGALLRGNVLGMTAPI
jgi:hypothetical protein